MRGTARHKELSEPRTRTRKALSGLAGSEGGERRWGRGQVDSGGEIAKHGGRCSGFLITVPVIMSPQC